MARQTDRGIDYAVRHLRFGWWSLLVFLSVGFVLELLHGFKAGFYLDVDNEARRLMWTLAHAHGALLSVVHVAWALCLRAFPDLEAGSPRAVSRCLTAASVLLPGGFFAGGVQLYGGDPGLGVAAAPAGAACLGIGVFLTARAALKCGGGRRAADAAAPPAGPAPPRRGDREGRRR